MSSLVYLFILNEPGFEPFGINFSDDLKLAFDGERLAIDSAPDLYRGILGPRIQNINIIAGENGVGKSTLLKTIASILAADPEDEEFAPERQYLLVYQAGPKHLVIADHLLREDDGDTPLQLGKAVQHYYIERLMRSRNDLRRSLIYYSPFLDFNVLSMGSSDADEDTRVFDISQTAIISRDLEDNGDRMDMTAPILFHKFKNAQRQISYINSSRNSLGIPFKLPERIDLYFNRLKADKDDLSTFDGILYDKLQEYCAKHLREHPRNQLSNEMLARILFLRNLVTMYFLAINFDKSQLILSHRMPGTLHDRITDFENNDASRLIELLLLFFREQDVFSGSFFAELISLVFRLIDEEGAAPHFMSSHNLLVLSVVTNSPGIRSLFELLEGKDNYPKPEITVSQAVHKLISFEWRNFSSGEKMFLDLFSRISSLRPQIPEAQSVLVILDEAEIGFHPSWQLKYVRLLRDFFTSGFDGRPVQLLLATHSPLVLSDLPRERVHLFQRSPETGLVHKAPPIGTLAQNVSSLLANEFFIDTALVGDLAAAYVDQILANLADPKVSTAAIRSAIGLIDEPLVRQLLEAELKQRRDA